MHTHLAKPLTQLALPLCFALLSAQLLFPGSSRSQAILELEPVPSVSLEAMEPAVQDQLRAQLTALEKASQAFANSVTNSSTSNLEQRALATAYGELGQIYLIYDLTAPALVALSNASTLNPQEPRWHYLVGTLFELDAEQTAAAKSYRQALDLALSAGAAPALLNPIRSRLARTLRSSQQFASAKPLFEQLAKAPAFEAFGHYGLGRVAAEQGDHPRAVRHLASALASQPRANQIHYQLGLSYRALGDLDKAKFHLANRGDGTATFPDPIVMELQNRAGGSAAMLTLGRISLATGALDVAEQRFRKALEIDATSAAAHQALGNLFRQRGDQGAAIHSFEKAVQLSPDDASLRFLVAQLLADSASNQRGDDQKLFLEQASQHLDEALLLAPDSLAGRVLHAKILATLGHYQRADRLYQGGLNRTPEAFDLHYLRAQTLANRIATLATNPKASVAAWGELGRSSIREFLDGLESSGKPLAQAAELDLGLLQLRLGDSVPGRARLQALLDSTTPTATLAAQAAFYLGNEAAQRVPAGSTVGTGSQGPSSPSGGSPGAGSPAAGPTSTPTAGVNPSETDLDRTSPTSANQAAQAALSFYQRALSLAPDFAEAHFNLGTLLGRLGQYDAATRHYRALIRLQPENHAARFSHATALVLGGQHAQAKAALESALEVLPSSPALAHLLTRLLVSSPDDSVRDATVGLNLASRIFEALPTPEHGETVAMAFAEAGRFDKAVQWQQRVIEEMASEGSVQAEATRRLELYKANRPARSP